VVVDVHDISISTGSKPPKPSARFARQDDSPLRHTDISDDSVLLKVQLRRTILACSLVDASAATAFLSIGGLADGGNLGSDAGGYPSPSEEKGSMLQPCIRVIKPNGGSSNMAPITALSVDIPAVHGELSKPVFDSLQYWADDVSQFLERLSGNTKVDQEPEGDSRDASLIGSKFFAKSRTGSTSGLSSSTKETPESVIKLTVTESEY